MHQFEVNLHETVLVVHRSSSVRVAAATATSTSTTSPTTTNNSTTSTSSRRSSSGGRSGGRCRCVLRRHIRQQQRRGEAQIARSYADATVHRYDRLMQLQLGVRVGLGERSDASERTRERVCGLVEGGGGGEKEEYVEIEKPYTDCDGVAWVDGYRGLHPQSENGNNCHST